MPEVSIVVRAKDEASRTLQGIGRNLDGLGSTLLGVGAIGVTALAGLAAGASKLAYDAAMLEPVRVTFDNLTASIGSTADSMLEKLRPATMHMLSDADLMRAANKLMAMGLADTEDQAAKLAKMAITLGTAMGVDATTSLENFTLMLANQSIPRLDTFGISSGKVRQRIEELTEANEDMTRETAFMIATMEQGEDAMARVGDVSETGAVKIAELRAKMSNLKDTVGQALLPIFEVFLDSVLTPLVAKIEEWAPLITPVIEQFGELAKKVINPEEGDWVEYLNTEVYDALETAFGEETATKIADFVFDVITGIGDLITKSEDFRTELGEAAASLAAFATSDGVTLTINTLKTIGDLLGVIIDAMQFIAENWRPGWEALTGGGFEAAGYTPERAEQFQPWADWLRQEYEERVRPEVSARELQTYQEAYAVPTTTATTEIHVHGLPGLEEEIREIINREGRHTVARP